MDTEPRIILMCHQIVFHFDFLKKKSVKHIKNIFCLWVIHKQTAGRTWLVCSPSLETYHSGQIYGAWISVRRG